MTRRLYRDNTVLFLSIQKMRAMQRASQVPTKNQIAQQYDRKMLLKAHEGEPNLWSSRKGCIQYHHIRSYVKENHNAWIDQTLLAHYESDVARL